MTDLVKRGSETAKNGFKNEKDISNKFNLWKQDKDAQKWLNVMGYTLKNIDKVKAITIGTGHKTDVQVLVYIETKDKVDVQNISIKLVSNLKGFNQIDKRWIKKYKELWNFNSKIEQLLKHFTGEIKPKIITRDKRRMFLDEFTSNDQNSLIEWIEKNRLLIVSDTLKGREPYSASWMLVAQKIQDNQKWVLKPINVVMNHFNDGCIEITPRGSLKIGRITMQRKGGDGGRPSANMLQFKINPAELFEL
tara:strand:+ start:1159 stop:1905 length:747 start_codon:yes stop_codon:yes gene_type:complete